MAWQLYGVGEGKCQPVVSGIGPVLFAGCGVSGSAGRILAIILSPERPLLHIIQWWSSSHNGASIG